MKIIKTVFLFSIFVVMILPQTHAGQIRYEEILELSKHFELKSYEYAIQNKAEIIPVES